MARWAGNIGYIIEEETKPGVWTNRKIERSYKGSIEELRGATQAVGINGDVTLSMKLSIVSDPFAYENFMHIKYATYMGKRWCVKSATPQRPRLILTLGDIYNAQS